MIFKRLFLLALLVCLSAPAFAQDKNETAYERVMRTKTIRCAYIVFPPNMIKDPNTGDFSGISYDIAEEMARRLELKIDWVEEVNFSTMLAGLETNRYNSVCFTLYRDTRRAPFADFTLPLFYNTQGTFVRTDDARFDKDKANIGNPDVTIATIDGEMSTYIAAEDFPKAKTFSMPQSTDAAQMLESVAAGKADVALVNSLVAAGYMKANPGKLREINTDQPVRVFSLGLMTGKGQYDLIRTMDITLAEMQDNGFIRKVLDKYDPDGKAYFRVTRPYETAP